MKPEHIRAREIDRALPHEDGDLIKPDSACGWIISGDLEEWGRSWISASKARRPGVEICFDAQDYPQIRMPPKDQELTLTNFPNEIVARLIKRLIEIDQWRESYLRDDEFANILIEGQEYAEKEQNDA